jgi:hypothetical protein
MHREGSASSKSRRNQAGSSEWKMMQDKGVMLLSPHHSGLRRPATPVGEREVSYLFRETPNCDAVIPKSRTASSKKPS